MTTTSLPAAKTARIRELNDQFRRTFRGGTVVHTAGIAALPSPVKSTIHDHVRHFDAFEADNDPWGEHDSGQFDHEGVTILWKIDYYDPSLTWLSEDPADPRQTARMLTIMRAEEY